MRQVTQFHRICPNPNNNPKCKIDLYYKNRHSLYIALNVNSCCYSCVIKERKHRKHSEETKRKIALSKVGLKLPARTQIHKERQSNSQRLRRQREILRDGGFWQKGKHEKQLLDLQEIKDNCTIDRNFYILGYFPDGYCHETNTIYEVYEEFHKKHIERDRIRQERIQNRLNCQFKIIWDL